MGSRRRRGCQTQKDIDKFDETPEIICSEQRGLSRWYFVFIAVFVIVSLHWWIKEYAPILDWLSDVRVEASEPALVLTEYGKERVRELQQEKDDLQIQLKKCESPFSIPLTEEEKKLASKRGAIEKKISSVDDRIEYVKKTQCIIEEKSGAERIVHACKYCGRTDCSRARKEQQRGSSYHWKRRRLFIQLLI